jgi:hypothetical protein
MRRARKRREQAIGKRAGTFVVDEVSGETAILTCRRCRRQVARHTWTVLRAIAGGDGLARCPHCDVLASPTTLARTGLTPQALQQRIANGWTREEATTLPKGEMPERLRVERAARARVKRNIKSGQQALARALPEFLKPGVEIRPLPGVPLYHAYAKDPRFLVRVLDGQFSVGQLINGQFVVPARRARFEVVDDE